MDTLEFWVITALVIYIAASDLYRKKKRFKEMLKEHAVLEKAVFCINKLKEHQAFYAFLDEVVPGRTNTDELCSYFVFSKIIIFDNPLPHDIAKKVADELQSRYDLEDVTIEVADPRIDGELDFSSTHICYAPELPLDKLSS